MNSKFLKYFSFWTKQKLEIQNLSTHTVHLFEHCVNSRLAQSSDQSVSISVYKVDIVN